MTGGGHPRRHRVRHVGCPGRPACDRVVVGPRDHISDTTVACLREVFSGGLRSRPPPLSDTMTSRRCWAFLAPPCTATFPMVCRSLRDSSCPPHPATTRYIANNGRPQPALPPGCRPTVTPARTLRNTLG